MWDGWSTWVDGSVQGRQAVRRQQDRTPSRTGLLLEGAFSCVPSWG